MSWSKIQSPLYSETISNHFDTFRIPLWLVDPYFGSSCRYGLIYHASLVGQSAPALKARTGDGISVRSLCWLHMFLSRAISDIAAMKHSIIFRVFFHECSHFLFFFLVGVSGFPTKTSAFFLRGKQKTTTWPTYPRVPASDGFPRARSVESLQPSSPCVVVWMRLEIRQLSGMDRDWWGWWRVGDKVGERLSWWQISKHIYIYIDTPMEMEKKNM